MSRLAPIVLALAGVPVRLGLAQSAGAEPQLLPVSPTEPADGTVVEANGNPLDVKLNWTIPREPVPVRFFVEVLAIGQDEPREVFAAYVDQPPVEITVADGRVEYAWRVYTVGRDIADYVLSGWQRFLLQYSK